MTQVVALLVVSCTFLWDCSFLNDYQDSGEIKLTGLSTPVKVMRDKKGMAYIYAQNRDDAMMAHGFVTAQDRLFQMEVTRRFAQGRICMWKPSILQTRTITWKGISRFPLPSWKKIFPSRIRMPPTASVRKPFKFV